MDSQAPIFPTANLDPADHYHRRMRVAHRQQMLSLTVSNELYKRHNWRQEFRAKWGLK